MKEDRFTAAALAAAMEGLEAIRGTALAVTEASEAIRGTASAEATATRGTVLAVTAATAAMAASEAIRGTVLAAMAEATAVTRSIIGTVNISDHKRRALLLQECPSHVLAAVLRLSKIMSIQGFSVNDKQAHKLFLSMNFICRLQHPKSSLYREVLHVRSENEMMTLILDIAMKDERIRLVTLEGSRTNKNVPRDRFQDYDISYFVTDMGSFTSDESWLDQFGERMMMQKPEDMELFPPELGGWFSYLMLFKDHHKIDLTLIPVNQTEHYFTQSDGLAEILLDKDGRIKHKIIASDEQYHIKKPTPREFDDCCNEFWLVSTYVIKGLMRKEILFALDHMNDILRPNVLRMIAWNIGIENEFSLSVGKNYKYIQHYMNAKDWEILLNSYAGNTYESVWKALFDCQGLFRAYSKSVAVLLRYEYPEYDQQITEYTLKHYQRFQSDFSL